VPPVYAFGVPARKKLGTSLRFNRPCRLNSSCDDTAKVKSPRRDGLELDRPPIDAAEAVVTSLSPGLLLPFTGRATTGPSDRRACACTAHSQTCRRVRRGVRPGSRHDTPVGLGPRHGIPCNAMQREVCRQVTQQCTHSPPLLSSDTLAS